MLLVVALAAVAAGSSTVTISCPLNWFWIVVVPPRHSGRTAREPCHGDATDDTVAERSHPLPVRKNGLHQCEWLAFHPAPAPLE